MNVGSTFSGVGGMDLGLERAGMRVVFQAEADAWCRGILAQHWPDVPCCEDVRLVRRDDGADRGGRHGDASDWDGRWSADPGLDLLCGGSPCQDLSVAGRRAGLAGERSGLFFEFARIADELVRPGGWLLFENVPGLLTSDSGRDFGIVLRTLGDGGVMGQHGARPADCTEEAFRVLAEAAERQRGWIERRNLLERANFTDPNEHALALAILQEEREREGSAGAAAESSHRGQNDD